MSHTSNEVLGSQCPKRALIIGAGPAGLTAAYELLKRTGIQPIILEKSQYTGGISKTVNYKGNRIDIGGHRFFSKSDRVMDWWMNIMPIEGTDEEQLTISYQNKSRPIGCDACNSEATRDNVMLVRSRLSRIYYMKKFFDYPIALSASTMKNLGIAKMFKIGVSYIGAQLKPIKHERSLEDFFINRFGMELYETFFKDYTEKVWGVPCNKISPEWGKQRIKKLSVSKALLHSLKKKAMGKDNSIAQKDTDTSLIERFLYPKFGPGQLWELVAKEIQQMGGIIHHNCAVEKIEHSNNNIAAVHIFNKETGKSERYEADYFFSTMPVKELIGGMCPAAPPNIKTIADGLVYRDFMTVGLLLKRLAVTDEKEANQRIKDNWIYIQESEVKIGRLQIFNNWSPYMVKDAENVWIGLEYFCFKDHGLWNMPDQEFIDFAIDELVRIKIIDKEDVLDSTLLREEKTYPAYFGTYDQFDQIKEYVNGFKNLFLIGRNGMHKYNNSDHSMLTAMTAVDNIIAGVESKENIWDINTEQEYHEKK
ncbi:MAG: NAD(P)/FAD-dependent oxidoreductase [Flavipsychrobacter sp.]|nr:NAD(P)/FAD-dependent oxidoreductase [Flavipsychrobacter sp.]